MYIYIINELAAGTYTDFRSFVIISIFLKATRLCNDFLGVVL